MGTRAGCSVDGGQHQPGHGHDDNQLNHQHPWMKSYCHPAILPSYHLVILSAWQLVNLSALEIVNLQACQLPHLGACSSIVSKNIELPLKVVPDQTWSGEFFSLSLGNVGLLSQLE